jgi:hypothetical protein
MEGTMKDSRVMSEPEMLAENDSMPSKEPLQPSEQELQAEIVEILSEARRGLTEDSIYAVMALRLDMGIYQALVDLILEGKVEAEVIDEKAKLTSNNFRFRHRPDEEPDQTERPVEAAP